ncbi:MAG: flagellar M-ring protein [Planctomycetota bacterium]|nr:MAG: flagellar M-ring protein [Planctomycetota bacterium]
MDVLREQLKRVREFLSKLSGAQRVSLALLALVVVASFFLLFAAAPGRSMVPLTPAGSPADVTAAVLESLKAKAVPYKLENGIVMVPPEKRDELFVQLYGDGVLPQGKNQFEWLWTQDVWTTTEARQRLQWTDTLRRRLEGAIASMDAVEAAAVQIAPGEDPETTINARPAKASVHLKLKRGRTPGDVNGRAIAEMVAASIPNLEPEAVIITDTAMNSYEVPDPRQPHVLAGTALQLKKEHEEFAAKKAKDALSFLSKVSVQAAVELDMESVEKETNKAIAPESAVRVTETTEKPSSAVGGIPGVASALEPGGLGEPGATGTGTPEFVAGNETTSRREFDNVFGSEKTHTVTPPGKIKGVTLAVVVPYAEASLGADGSKPATAEAIQENLSNNLRDWTMLVARACSVDVAQIKMHPVTFPEPVAVAAPVVASEWRDIAARYGEKAVLVLLVLAGLFFIWRIVRASVPRDVLAEIERVRAELAIPPEGPSLDPATAAADLRSARLQEKVTDLMRRNPQAGANLIRNWIVRGE